MRNRSIGNERGHRLAEDDLAKRGAVEHLAARRAARHASAIISVIQDGLLTVDEHGRIADVNVPLCTMSGFTRAELIGRRRFPFLPDADAKANAAVLRTALNQDDLPAAVRITLVRKTGECVPVMLWVAALRNSEGDLLGYVGALRELVVADPWGGSVGVFDVAKPAA